MQSTEQCEECEYKNVDIAELIVHIVKERNSCECCDPKLWLEQSSWVRVYDRLNNIEREDALLRLQYREVEREVERNKSMSVQITHDRKQHDIKKTETNEI